MKRCAATHRVLAEFIRCKHEAGHTGWHRGSSRGIESVWTDNDADPSPAPPRAKATKRGKTQAERDWDLGITASRVARERITVASTGLSDPSVAIYALRQAIATLEDGDLTTLDLEDAEAHIGVATASIADLRAVLKEHAS